MKSVIFVAVCCFFATNQAVKLDIPQYVCSLMVNGTKIRDNTAACSTKYYNCFDGNAYEAKCPTKQTLDKDRQICVPTADYDCPKVDICSGYKKGAANYFPDPYSCDGYYLCTSTTKGSLGYCSDHMSFEDGRCWEDDRCNIELCLLVPSYRYFGVYGDCNGWQRCKGSELETQSCGTGMIFDRDDGTCDATKTESTECRPSQDHFGPKVGAFCDSATFGFQIVPDSCTSYFYCHNGKIGQETCAQGKFFTGSVCTDRLNYPCTRGNNPCEGLNKSTHSSWRWINDPTNCSKYYYCSNGQVVGGSATCSSDSPYFNAERQVCSATKPSYTSCVV